MRSVLRIKTSPPWGGMALMKKLLDHCDIDSMLSTLGLPEPGSNRGYKPEEIIKSYLVSVWCGANRFMHTEVTHRDAVIEISETQYQGIHGSLHGEGG